MNISSKNYRIISCMLMFSVLLSSLSSCSSGGTNNEAEENTASADGTEIEVIAEEETDRSQIKDGLPDDLDFGGESFLILDRDNDDVPEHFAEEMTGEAVNDALFLRNSKIEERLNVKYSVYTLGSWATYSDSLAAIRASVNSGSDDYQMVNGYSIHIVNLAAENLFLDLRQMEYLDLSQQWWRESVNKEMCINGKQYFATGDINITTVSSADAFFANKTVMSQFEMPDIYSIVKEGRWTYDTLLSLVKDVYLDSNGNGVKDDQDTYGAAFTCMNSADGMLAAFHQNVTEFGENGYPVICLNNEKTVDIIEKLYRMWFETEGVFPTNGDDWAPIFNLFKTDKAAFICFILKYER